MSISGLGSASQYGVQVLMSLKDLITPATNAMKHSLARLRAYGEKSMKALGHVMAWAAKKGWQSFKEMADKVYHKLKSFVKWATLGAMGWAGFSVKMASDMVESENLFEVSMGRMAKSSRKWSEQVAKDLHMNAVEIRKTVGMFNVMFGSMGFDENSSQKMSQNLTMLAKDMESFYNLGAGEGLEKLKAGITGEAEPLKRLGILVNETTVKTYAYKAGIAAVGEELDNNQKVLARYGMIMEATNKAQGDLKRTLNTTQNVFRSVKNQVVNAAQAFGTGLLPAVTNAATKIRDWLIENMDNFAKWGERIGIEVNYVVDVIGAIWKDKSGWVNKWAAIWDALIEIVKGASRSLVSLAIGIGESVYSGLMKGLFSDRNLEDKTREIYERDNKYVTGPFADYTGTFPVFNPKKGGDSYADRNKWLKAEEEAKKKIAEERSKDTQEIMDASFSHIKDIAKDTWSNMFKGLENSPYFMPETTDAIKTAGKNKDTQLFSWEDKWKNPQPKAETQEQERQSSLLDKMLGGWKKLVDMKNEAVETAKAEYSARMKIFELSKSEAMQFVELSKLKQVQLINTMKDAGSMTGDKFGSLTKEQRELWRFGGLKERGEDLALDYYNKKVMQYTGDYRQKSVVDATKKGIEKTLEVHLSDDAKKLLKFFWQPGTGASASTQQRLAGAAG